MRFNDTLRLQLQSGPDRLTIKDDSSSLQSLQRTSVEKVEVQGT